MDSKEDDSKKPLPIPPAINIDPPSSPTPESSSVTSPEAEAERTLLEVPGRRSSVPRRSSSSTTEESDDDEEDDPFEQWLTGTYGEASPQRASSSGSGPPRKKKSATKFVLNAMRKAKKAMASAVEKARSLTPRKSPKKKDKSPPKEEKEDPEDEGK